jgi:hypothetical protein
MVELNIIGSIIKDYGPTFSTFVLIAITWKYVSEVGHQASIMSQQMNRDRLVKKYEKLTKEMTLLVGPLYAIRDDYLIKTGGLGESSPSYKEHRSFWGDIRRNMYLARRDLLPKLEDYFSAMHTYKYSPSGLYGKTESASGIFDAKTKDLIQQIDISYRNLLDAIRETEKELDSAVLQNQRSPLQKISEKIWRIFGRWG